MKCPNSKRNICKYVSQKIKVQKQLGIPDPLKHEQTQNTQTAERNIFEYPQE